jgi:hypothetical protein
MRLRTVSVVVGLLLAATNAVEAQYRNGQARSQSAAPRPGPPRAPAGEAPFRNTATFRPRPISPSLGIPIRGRGVPVFPLLWGWGTMPFYYGQVSTPFTLEEGPTGGVQLDVQPWRAAVFVDGVYAGRADDFSGYYKHLEVVAGPHQIVIVESGYEPLVIDAIVVPGETSTYRGTLTSASGR